MLDLMVYASEVSCFGSPGFTGCLACRGGLGVFEQAGVRDLVYNKLVITCLVN